MPREGGGFCRPVRGGICRRRRRNSSGIVLRIFGGEAGRP